MAATVNITTMDQSKFPAAPKGWKYVNLTDPDKLQFDPQHYPVLLYGGYTYTALSTIVNNWDMLIIAFDAAGNIVKQVQKARARYIWKITYDSGKQTVTFTGQGHDSVQATLAELAVDHDTTRISTMDESKFPAAPEGWKYVNLTDPEKLQDDPAHYPVLLYDGYTYTALSTIVNNWDMLIIGFDANGSIVKKVQKTGARYLWQIAFDSSTQVVTFTGQSHQAVKATLDELTVENNNPRVSTMDEANFPAAPEGWKYVNLTDPNKLQFDPTHYPVLLYGGYTYTALSTIVNNWDMLIIGFDSDGCIVKKVQKTGARYLWQITVKPGTQVVTFAGQSRQTVQATLAELAVEDNEPRVSTMNQSKFPTAPKGWDYVNLTDPDKLQFDPAHYPVLIYDGITYTVLSTIVNNMDMLIIGFDATNTIVKKVVKTGARYIWKIAYDASGQLVTFTGQARNSVNATLAELATEDDAPRVSTMNESEFPSAPEGWKYVNLTDPDKLQFDPQHYPVLLYGGYTYTALSTIVNDDNMLIIGWDSEGKIVQEVKKHGARYIWEITLSADKKTVAFIGQSRSAVRATLEELTPATAPKVTTMDQALFPAEPEGWKYTNLDDPDKLGGDPKVYPVLLFGGNTYTALSDVHNMDAMLIIGWDAQKKILKQERRPGARYLWQIKVNLDTQSVTFIGQARESVQVTLDDLR